MDLYGAGCCNDSNERSSKKLHVLMFPWLARGHFSIYAELTNRLADRGINVSFLTTPLNVPKMEPLFNLANRNLPGKVQVVELPFPAVEGLPPGIECTADTPAHLWPLLLRAVFLLEEPFESVLRRLAPDVVVFDLMQYWTPRVATKLGIPTVLFFTFSAAYLSYHLSPPNAEYGEEITAEDLMVPPPGYPSSTISWRPFEAQFTLKMFHTRDDTEGMRVIDRQLTCIDGCETIAIKSCYEFEEKLIKYFERVTGKPVIPVGPLLQSNAGPQDSECLKWLGRQAASSVVYACFGTECFLSNEEIREVALGLEASGHPFILVLRFAGHCDGSTSLPEAFEGRIRDRGLVLTDWAPQKEILSHPSTVAFLTHCGWSSLTEGMSVGLPLIALLMQWDQGLNARLIVNELKVGVEVARRGDGAASREDICRAVRAVMAPEDGEEGKDVRQRASQMGDMFRRTILNGESKGSEERYIDKFVQHLLALATDKGGHGCH
uniref:Glycosyltransferase N-terminal domain-containing protein n=1 Tax=Picea sitchensis TaxID=3332 RepID=B8LK73_PICSI|nr:unknown [Picea sitchensis]